MKWVLRTPESDIQPRESSTWSNAYVVRSRPRPPYRSGIVTPNNPRSLICATRSAGYVSACSRSEATGIRVRVRSVAPGLVPALACQVEPPRVGDRLVCVAAAADLAVDEHRRRRVLKAELRLVFGPRSALRLGGLEHEGDPRLGNGDD